ncbi:hypothetical protein C8R46DRAFT_1042138 [Mycena filopes]|nr:hypothetical protein C8R46DRAFT_1042138 [Mycena filopes]
MTHPHVGPPVFSNAPSWRPTRQSPKASDKLAPTSEDEGPPFPVGPRQQSFPDAGFHLHGTDNEPIDGDERTLVEALPTADKDLSDSAAVPTLSTTVLVGGDGDAQVECDEMMELGELLYPEMRDIKECIGAAFEVARVCYFCLDHERNTSTLPEYAASAEKHARMEGIYRKRPKSQADGIFEPTLRSSSDPAQRGHTRRNEVQESARGVEERHCESYGSEKF